MNVSAVGLRAVFDKCWPGSMLGPPDIVRCRDGIGLGFSSFISYPYPQSTVLSEVQEVPKDSKFVRTSVFRSKGIGHGNQVCPGRTVSDRSRVEICKIGKKLFKM